MFQTVLMDKFMKTADLIALNVCYTAQNLILVRVQILTIFSSWESNSKI